MTGRPAPHDLDAERAVLGMLLSMPYLIDEAAQNVDAEDFFSPRHGQMFAALGSMFADGASIDAVSVTARLAHMLDPAPDRAEITELTVDAPVSSHLPTHLNRVIEMASRRRLITAADEINRTAYDTSTSWVDVAALAAERVAYAAAEIDAIRPTMNVADFIDRYDVEPDWLVPRMIERGDRVLIVGREASGKSVLLRQWAVQIAAGLHPRNRVPIEPRRVLLIDLENGPRLMAQWIARLWGLALEGMPNADPDFLRIETRPDGLDVTTRGDRRWLAARVADARPDLIVLGPLYKLHRGEEERSTDAGLIAGTLDTIRARFNCAMLLETHAPHESFKDGGKLRPAGSRVWLRWPDFVLGLKPQRPSVPRGPHILDDSEKARDVRLWPRMLTQTDRWPWDTIERNA